MPSDNEVHELDVSARAGTETALVASRRAQIACATCSSCVVEETGRRGRQSSDCSEDVLRARSVYPQFVERGAGVLVQRPDIAALMANAIGPANAEAVTDAACAALGLGDAVALQVDEAMSILERIAGEPGIVGVAARFAKSRAIFRWR